MAVIKKHVLLQSIFILFVNVDIYTSQRCQEITSPICKDLHYNMTIFPNFFHHEIQEKADFAVSMFSPLIEYKCHPNINFFLCTLYFPVCTILGEPIPPCRDFCELVKSSCNKVMMREGINWPSEITCKDFPLINEGICIKGSSESQETTPGPIETPTPPSLVTTTPPASLVPQRCQEITRNICTNLPYNMTIFPNFFHHETQEKADFAVSEFSSLIEQKCHPNINFFLCTLYFPVCTILEEPIPPCRDFCELVKSSCNEVMVREGINWPSEITCKDFPLINEGICIKGSAESQETTPGPIETPTPPSLVTTTPPSLVTTTPPSLVPQRCQEITRNICTDLPYNMTIFPNFFHHKTQEKADFAVSEFSSLIEQKCHPNINFFLCTLYFPVCTILARPIPPCRELCEVVKSSCNEVMLREGINWPSEISCELFPTHGQLCIEGNDGSHGTTPGTTEFTSPPSMAVKDAELDIIPHHGRCEPLRVPFYEDLPSHMCTNMPYNMTIFPNFFQHETQEKADLAAMMFSSLIEHECHPLLNFFLCTLYFPICTILDRPIPPCRELCEVVKSSCNKVIVREGINWPSEITCNDFPLLNEGICIEGSAKSQETTPGPVETPTPPSLVPHCEPLRIPYCKDLSYNTTLFPNYFNETQDLAIISTSRFMNIVENYHSAYLKIFLCHLYAPVCTELHKIMLPCQNVCQAVKKRFLSSMTEHGISWPLEIDCDKLPPAGSICFEHLEMHYTTDVKENQCCEELRIPQCKSLPYNLTLMPNILNHQTQEGALSEFTQYSELLEHDDSHSLLMFLCSVYTPACLSPGYMLPPCQHLCLLAKEQYESFPTKVGLTWPLKFDCNQFPGKEDKTCLDENFLSINSSLQHVLIDDLQAASTNSCRTIKLENEETNCEPISSPLCADLPYDTTFPNILGHLNQEEAGLEVHQLFPLVKVQCSINLRQFLCSVYFPKCKSKESIVLPCQEFCISAKEGCEKLMNKFGFTWPDYLNCDRFPELSNGTECMSATEVITNPSTELTITSPKQPFMNFHKKCEPVTVPMCKDYSYNTTLPMFLYENQEEVGLIMHQFLPLVEMQCSPKLQEFLCAFYLPKCNENGSAIGPCQALCLSAKNGCESIMAEYGFSWPTSMDCSLFPVDFYYGPQCVSSFEDSSIRSTITMTAVPDFSLVTAQEHCEPISSPLCRNFPYETTFPNILGHSNQEEAGLEVHQFFPLVKIQCSPNLSLFLCSLYFPKCIPKEPLTPPCKELCLSAKDGCEDIMNRFGFMWPDSLDCHKFPNSSSDIKCISAT